MGFRVIGAGLRWGGFFIIKTVAVRSDGRRSPHEWQRERLVKNMTLLPRLLLSLLPAHLTAHSSKDNIRHAPHGGQVRGHVIRDITFLL